MSLHSDLNSWLKNHAIRHLCLDSREIEPGDAFVVLAGATHDASRFIPQAIANGATALIVEDTTEIARNGIPSLPQNVAHIIIPQLRSQLSSLADAWYGHPSRELRVIGITGTNGKTSSTQWIAQGLQSLGHPAGTIGTLGCTGLANPPKHEHTTPDVLSLQRWLRAYVNEQVRTVAIEVSSHALDQRRADDVHFHTALFTNLSRDHLDYHTSFEDYAEAKARLFTHHSVQHAVINIDDSWGQELARRWKFAHANAPLITIGLDQPADLRAVVKDTPSGLELSLNSDFGTGQVKLPHLNGRFNASNVLGVIGVWLHAGLSWDQILTLLPAIQPAPGRMNKFGGRNGAPTIIVDFAHTPDALEKVLLALHPLRETTGGKLWCIFGAGGDRDPGKRPIMGAFAAQHANRVVITSDNPRSENPSAIAQSIYEGIPGDSRDHVSIEVDRRIAIRQALDAASSQDIVLIAGKGHESTQEVSGIKTPFSDTEEVLTWLDSQTPVLSL